MLAIIVCAAVLVLIGYFAALCGAEFVWWLRDRVSVGQRTQAQTSSISRRQIVTR